MATGVAFPMSQANEPGSVLVPGESFSPFLLYDCGCDAPPVLNVAPQSITVELPAVSTLIAPAPQQASGIDWVVVLIVAGILLIAIGGNQ